MTQSARNVGNKEALNIKI